MQKYIYKLWTTYAKFKKKNIKLISIYKRAA